MACVLIAATFSGCAVGPDFKRPAPPAAERFSPQPLPEETASVANVGDDKQRFDAKTDIPFDWWTLFQSPKLNSLIERSFAANPDIQSAQAALRQAQEYANAQRGFFYPTAAANYTASRNKIAGNMSSSAPGLQANGNNLQSTPPNATYYNFHVAQLTIGYAPDVFGLNRREVESADALVALQKLQMNAAYITLASNVVAAAIEEASLRAQIDAMQQIVDDSAEVLAILHNQLRLGYVSGIDVAAQESALASAQQSLVPLRNQLQKTRDLIRALAGHLPSDDVEETFDLSSLQLPQELPLSLPSQVVEQRPDVRAAEEQLHFATAQAGVAKAKSLPQFAITGALGGMADNPDWLFRSGGGFFDLTASVSQTIFDGGVLRAQSRAAQQALIQAGAQYRSTVIAALQNVADTLYTIHSDAESLKAATNAANAAENALNITRKQHRSGYVNYQTVLAAEQVYQLSLINRVQAQTNRLGDTAALYQALGGGWWNHPATAVAPTNGESVQQQSPSASLTQLEVAQ